MAQSSARAKRESKKLTLTNGRAAVSSAAASALGTGLRAILANRAATVAAVIMVVLLVCGMVDTVANWGKAYENVSVAGVDVGGQNAEEIESTLRNSLGPTVSHAQVSIYASDEARELAGRELTDEEKLAQIEKIAQAEQISVEDATAAVTTWSTDALTLKADIPYEELVEKALAVGRGDGGLLTRIACIFMGHDVGVDLTYDEDALEALAAEIDKTIGDERIDATVSIEDGVATPVEGHDGRMVDREWLARQVSQAMTSNIENPSFVAVVADAPSRITFEQAQKTSDGVNRALQVGAVFSYKGTDFNADGTTIGSWTKVETAATDNGYDLKVSIDKNEAIPAVVKGAAATVTSDSVTVKFSRNDAGEIAVRTFGSGNIPEVSPAVDALQESLYGDAGVAWNLSASDPVNITIEESSAPAAVTLDQAIELGIVTVIGEYTTEFSNYEGTENRNHNIKLAADILDNGIIEAEGGTWKFNDRSGDTNEAAGFWAAGSIVDGEYVDSIGGGICQVATTIFNAVYESGLPINMRFNHTLYIASYPTGRDAAVSYPDLDLEWTNNTSSDVLLDMSYTDTTITATLYSVYTGYTVESQTGEWREGKKYKTEFEEDSSLGKDEHYTKTTGVDGSSISVVRTVKNEKGEVISEQTFESSYDPKNEVIVVGPGTDTKKLERKTDSASNSEATGSEATGSNEG